MSYAGLVYSGDTTDPVRAKFYGDTQERLTAASTRAPVLRARAQPYRGRGARRGHERRSRSRITGPGSRICARTSPIQLDDRIEQLFHEKSVTGRSAWNRLFDETIASLALQCARRGTAHRADAQQAAGPGRERAQGRLGCAGQDLQGESAHLHAHHQHARQGQGDLRPLARLRGRGRFPPSGEPGRARGGGGAGRPPCARPIRACRTATTR